MKFWKLNFLFTRKWPQRPVKAMNSAMIKVFQREFFFRLFWLIEQQNSIQKSAFGEIYSVLLFRGEAYIFWVRNSSHLLEPATWIYLNGRWCLSLYKSMYEFVSAFLPLAKKQMNSHYSISFMQVVFPYEAAPFWPCHRYQSQISTLRKMRHSIGIYSSAAEHLCHLLSEKYAN